MLKLIWTVCSIILIILILLRLPSKDGAVQSFNVSTGMLGSPKTTDNKLQIFAGGRLSAQQQSWYRHPPPLGQYSPKTKGHPYFGLFKSRD